MTSSVQDFTKAAGRYAKALLDAAQEQNNMAAVRQDLDALSRLVLEVPELMGFLTNPMIPDVEKHAVVREKLQSGLNPLFARLLDVLLENDRLALLPYVLEESRKELAQRDGVVTAYVTVPVVLNEDLQSRLRQTLQSTFGYRRVDLDVRVEPAILAGAIVKIGDQLIDGSYSGKLETLRKQVG